MGVLDNLTVIKPLCKGTITIMSVILQLLNACLFESRMDYSNLKELILSQILSTSTMAETAATMSSFISLQWVSFRATKERQ